MPTDSGNYFYTSSPSSIFGMVGYIEQCLYGSKDLNYQCTQGNPRATDCPPDMIYHSTATPNNICQRCESGTGHQRGRT